MQEDDKKTQNTDFSVMRDHCQFGLTNIQNTIARMDTKIGILATFATFGIGGLCLMSKFVYECKDKHEIEAYWLVIILCIVILNLLVAGTVFYSFFNCLTARPKQYRGGSDLILFPFATENTKQKVYIDKIASNEPEKVISTEYADQFLNLGEIMKKKSDAVNSAIRGMIIQAITLALLFVIIMAGALRWEKLPSETKEGSHKCQVSANTSKCFHDSGEGN